jgi:predicted anti-sigma-YlaC factor YlaD
VRRAIRRLWPADGGARFLAAALVLAALPSCTMIKRKAIGSLGDTLASGGTVYEADDDPDLVGQALPFGLKLIESLLAEVPDHPGLLLAACRGFTTYTYAYVHLDADIVADRDIALARAMRARAGRLYRRARAYGLRGLERKHPGIGARLQGDPRAAAAELEQDDLPLLYWTAAALGLGISANRNDPEMLARLPEVNALIDRALDIDEAWQEGALHEFEIILVGTRPGSSIHDLDDIRRHYERALALSGGKRAGLYLTYAETVSVRRQDAGEFRALLERALAIDPDTHVEVRLANLLAQRRALWLLDRIDAMFLDASPAAAGETPP